MLVLVVWLVIGAIAGMIVHWLEGRNRSQSLPIHVLVGVVGALLGGAFFSFAVFGTLNDANDRVDIRSIVAAFIAAGICLGLSYVTGRSTRQRQ